MPRACTNKYQTALEILQKGRDVLVDELAEAVVDHGDDLIESPFLLTELLEGHGSKLQFLMILMSQLERTAEEHESLGTIRVACCDEPDPAAPRRRRRRRSRRGRRRNAGVHQNQGSSQGSAEQHSPDEIDF
jgi:hypothetical protein